MAEEFGQMDDGGESAFLAALESKLGASPEETTPVDPESEAEAETEVEAEAPAERARDEHGRFVKQEEEPEAEVAEEPQTAEEAVEELIAGKFRSQDELLEAYKQLEQRMGEQGSELGELRKLREEVEEMRVSLETDDDPVPDQSTLSWFDQQVDENPAQAAVWALQNNQDLLYEKAIKVLADEDPFMAGRIDSVRMRAEIQAEFQQQYEPQLQTVRETNQNQQFNQAWRNVQGRLPELPKFADAILEAAKSAPEVVGALQSGDLASKERVIENLYMLAKGRQADTFKEAAAEVARKQTEENRAAKKEATVASASSTPSREGKSWKDELRESIVAAAQSDSIEAGLTRD